MLGSKKKKRHKDSKKKKVNVSHLQITKLAIYKNLKEATKKLLKLKNGCSRVAEAKKGQFANSNYITL
jgi:hypothetical protein